MNMSWHFERGEQPCLPMLYINKSHLSQAVALALPLPSTGVFSFLNKHVYFGDAASSPEQVFHWRRVYPNSS